MGEILSDMAWVIRVYYHHTSNFNQVQSIFVRDVIFNSSEIVDGIVVTTDKKRKFYIDNVCEITTQVKYGYTVGNLLYVYNTGIYHNIDNKKLNVCIVI